LFSKASLVATCSSWQITKLGGVHTQCLIKTTFLKVLQEGGKILYVQVNSILQPTVIIGLQDDTPDIPGLLVYRLLAFETSTLMATAIGGIQYPYFCCKVVSQTKYKNYTKP
jgi:hypothetical protein